MYHMLFAGMSFYPWGGFKDFRGLFPSLEEADEEGKRIAEECLGWWHVVDMTKMEIVSHGVCVDLQDGDKIDLS